MRTIHLYLMAALAVSATLLFSVPAFAVAPAAGEPVTLIELLSLFVDAGTATKVVGIITFVCFLITHALALLPPRWVAKWPTWLIRLVHRLGGNYRNTKNAPENDPLRLRQAG